jgi:hypothetical protein
MIELSEWAREVLARSAFAATRFNPDAHLRLSVRAGALDSSLTDAPEPGDEHTTVEGHIIYVEASIDGLVDVESPHDRLVLRPAGSHPNPRP